MITVYVKTFIKVNIIKKLFLILILIFLFIKIIMQKIVKVYVILVIEMKFRILIFNVLL